MHLIKKVGRRVKGMGLKITKFHCIMHLTDDILNFGVPMEVDTGSNESAHKAEKTAAKLTQKKKDLFDQQTCNRLQEIHLLELANQELNGRQLWNYYDLCPTKTPEPQKDEKVSLGGQQFYVVHEDQDNANYAILVTRKRGNQKMNLEQDLINFVYNLQCRLPVNNKKAYVSSTYHRGTYIFRASTNFHGKPWRDWVIIDWGDEGELPCHLMGFLDLSVLDNNILLNYGGQDSISPGIYAIVESSSYVAEEDAINLSELFIPIQKHVGGFTGSFVSHRTFFLADVECIVGPVAVIPDLGGQANDYLQLRTRNDWKQDFINWLESPHDDDIIESSEEESEGEDNDNDSA